MSNSIQQRAHQWIVSDDTGSSSKCLWAVMMGVEPDSWRSSPSDAGDLGRCLRLLELIPEWKPNIHRMRGVSNYWDALVLHWDELTRLYFEETAGDPDKSAGLTYKRMRQILDPVTDADRNAFRMKHGTVRFGPVA